MQVFSGQNCQYDGALAFAYQKNQEDEGPTFLYFADGMEVMKLWTLLVKADNLTKTKNSRASRTPHSNSFKPPNTPILSKVVQAPFELETQTWFGMFTGGRVRHGGFKPNWQQFAFFLSLICYLILQNTKTQQTLSLFFIIFLYISLFVFYKMDPFSDRNVIFFTIFMTCQLYPAIFTQKLKIYTFCFS